MKLQQDRNTGEIGWVDAQGNFNLVNGGQGPPNPNPTDALQASIIASGKGALDMATNVRNAASYLPGMSGLHMDPQNPDAYNQLRREHPVAATLGEASFGMVGPSPGGKFKAFQLPSDIIQGTIASDPNAPLLERAGLSALGSKVGDMAGRIVNRIRGIREFPDIDSVDTALIQQADDAGLPLTRAHRGTRADRRHQARMESGTFTSGIFKDMEDQADEVFSKAVGRAAGLPDDYIDTMRRFDIPALDRAKELNGAAFDEIGERIPSIDLNESFQKFISPEARELLARQGVELPETGGISLSGDQVMRVRSRLRKAKDGAYKRGEVDKGDLMSAYIDDLDDAIEAAAPTANIKGDYAKVRDQYRVLKFLDQPSGMKIEGGLTPKRLWNKIGNDKSPITQELRDVTQARGYMQEAIPSNKSETAGANAGLLKREYNRFVEYPLERINQWSGANSPRGAAVGRGLLSQQDLEDMAP